MALMGIYDSEKQEQFTPFSELCKFADVYGYDVQIEKPFKEMDNLFLKVLDKDGEEVYKITLDDISALNEESAAILNDLSKKN
jgi:hypothetical protein